MFNNLFKKKLVTDTLYSSLLFFINKPFSFLREVILMGLLGPYYYGLKEVLIMLVNYSSYTFIGSLSELYRKTSYGEQTEKSIYSLLMYAIFISLVIGLLVILFITFSSYNIIVKQSFILLIPLVLFFLMGNVFSSFFSGKAEFKSIAINEGVFIISSLILSLLLGYLFEYIGVIFAFVISYCIRLGMYYDEWLKLKVKFTFDINKIKTLMVDGINLFINNILETIYIQLDSLICVLMLGTYSLGIYAVASKVNVLIYSVLNSVLKPFEQKLIVNRNNEQMNEYLYMVMVLFSYVMVYPIILIVLLFPYVIDLFFPLFVESKVLIMILAPSALINVILFPLRGQLIAKKREKVITISTIIACIINVTFNIVFIYLGYGLVGISISTSISYFINLVLMYFMSGFFSVKRFILLLIPFIVMSSIFINFYILILLLVILFISMLIIIWKMKYVGLIRRSLQ